MDRAGRSLFYEGPFDWDQLDLSAATIEKSINTSAINTWGKDLVGTPLQFFLHLPEGSAKLQYIGSTIEALCDNKTLEEVLDGRFDPSPEEVAWLHDGPSTETVENKQCWHTQKSLYEALSKKRVCLNDSNDTDVLKSIRRLYLPNPDPRGLAPILATASSLEARRLSEFLYKYARSQPAICASIRTSEFVLEFHIPFYVWMDSKIWIRDERRGSNGDPLRQSWSLKFLSVANSSCLGDEVDHHLYESIWSCIIVGFNTSVWSAYTLTDSYFFEKGHRFDTMSPDYYKGLEKPEEEDDQGEEDEELGGGEGDEGEEDVEGMGYSRDPISGSETVDLNDPREYFFRILHNRTEHAFEHWTNNIDLFEEGARQYIHNEVWEDGPSSLVTAEDRSKAIENSKTWITKLSQILESLTEKIDSVCKSWDDFKEQDISLLYSGSENNPKLGLLLRFINRTFTDLKPIQKRLEKLMSKLDKFQRRLELHIQVQNNQAIVLQHVNVNYIQFMSPPTLGAALMQTKILPWQSGILPWIIISLVVWAATRMIKPAQKFFHKHPAQLDLETLKVKAWVWYAQHMNITWRPHIPRGLPRRREPVIARFNARSTDSGPPSPTLRFA